MATKKQIVAEVIKNQHESYTKEELNSLRMALMGTANKNAEGGFAGSEPLTSNEVKMISALSKNNRYGTIYSAFRRVMKDRKSPGERDVGRTPEEIKRSNPNLSQKQIERKIKQEESFDKAVNSAYSSMAMTVPVGVAFNILGKLAGPVLKKAMASETGKKFLARIANEGAKIPAKLQKMFNKVGPRLDDARYQVTGRLPPRTPQENINADMSRIARGMDKVQARSAVPPGPSSKIPQPLSDRIQSEAARIMSQPHAGASSPLSARPPLNSGSVGGVNTAIAKKAEALSKLGSRVMNPPLSADRSMATLASPRGYARADSGKIIPHMRASGPRHQETSPAFGPTNRAANLQRLAKLEQAAVRPTSSGARVRPTLEAKKMLAAALAQEMFGQPNNFSEDQADVLGLAVNSDSDSDSVYTTETEYPVPEYTDRESPEELIAEPGFGRMLGLRRSASEIDRDVAISDALEAGDYDRVAELEKEYGSSDWTESLTQRTKDYTPEQIDAMLDPEVSEGSTNVLQDIFEGFDVEPSKEDASYGSLLNKGGRVKKKKSKKKPNKMTKVYSNKTRKPTRI